MARPGASSAHATSNRARVENVHQYRSRPHPGAGNSGVARRPPPATDSARARRSRVERLAGDQAGVGERGGSVLVDLEVSRIADHPMNAWREGYSASSTMSHSPSTGRSPHSLSREGRQHPAARPARRCSTTAAA